MTKRLYMSNLSSNTTEAELNQLFARVGPVVELRIKTDPHTGAQRSFGIVEMETLDQAHAAIKSVHNTMLHEHKIQVRELRSTILRPNHDEDQPASRVIQRRARKTTKKSD